MNQRAFIVVGLGFGDEGKGTTVDFLCRKFNSDLVVRFNGGSQAAHNVVTPDGTHHTFSQFGAGTFHGAKTVMSKHTLVNPMLMDLESLKLRKCGIVNPYRNMFVDENALVITPFHKAANQLFEMARSVEKHGSCGQGIGETVYDSLYNPKEAIRVKDLTNETVLHEKLHLCRARLERRLKENGVTNFDEDGYGSPFRLKSLSFLMNWLGTFPNRANIVTSNHVSELIRNCSYPIFEGAQGILLDEDYGFHPYTTWSKTTSENAISLLTDALWQRPKEVIGVTRIYSTRHGAGPFPTASKYLSRCLKEDYNRRNRWQDSFKTGWLDMNLLQYALEADPYVSSLSITHVDKLHTFKKWKVCSCYKANYFPKKIGNSRLEIQEEMTRMLDYSKPAYNLVDSEKLLGHMEFGLDRRIRILSTGKDYIKKTWLTSIYDND